MPGRFIKKSMVGSFFFVWRSNQPSCFLVKTKRSFLQLGAMKSVKNDDLMVVVAVVVMVMVMMMII